MSDQTPLTSWAAVARALGIARQTLYKLREREDWPAGRALPLSEDDLERVRAWRAGSLQEDRSRIQPEVPQDVGEAGESGDSGGAAASRVSPTQAS